MDNLYDYVKDIIKKVSKRVFSLEEETLDLKETTIHLEEEIDYLKDYTSKWLEYLNSRNDLTELRETIDSLKKEVATLKQQVTPSIGEFKATYVIGELDMFTVNIYSDMEQLINVIDIHNGTYSTKQQAEKKLQSLLKDNPRKTYTILVTY